jgi:probable HAF family extracellular repeat protein
MKTHWLRNFVLGLVGAVVIALGLSIFTASSATTSFSYSVTDLGTLGGSFSQAYGINDKGQVVGCATTTSGSLHAFLWSNGTLQDLDTLGGSYSQAHGINNTGQVVGVAGTSSGFKHAFLWHKGTMKDLGILGGNNSHANRINNIGQVVGGAQSSSGTYHAFLWEKGKMKDLGTLGGNSSIASEILLGGNSTIANGINNTGQVVGSAQAVVVLPRLLVGKGQDEIPRHSRWP